MTPNISVPVCLRAIDSTTINNKYQNICVFHIYFQHVKGMVTPMKTVLLPGKGKLNVHLPVRQALASSLIGKGGETSRKIKDESGVDIHFNHG